MHAAVYHSQEIRAWEQRWFQKQNSSLGLMQQVAWSICNKLDHFIQKNSLSVRKIAVWCGMGNNAGDGYFLAAYLQQAGYQVTIFAAPAGESPDLAQAVQTARRHQLNIHSSFDVPDVYDCHVDALFGHGLNRNLDSDWQTVIKHFNQLSGFKVAIDLPSGLNANTGQCLPIAIKADITYTVLAHKIGLHTGQGSEFSGQVELIDLLPPDVSLRATALLKPAKIILPKRQAFGHKGTYGHVLVVGGHRDMGGAVIMAAEAAFHAGAGKVTVVCDATHHAAILARAPNIMIKDIQALTSDEILTLLQQIDSVCFGMGLGRDEWSEKQFMKWCPVLLKRTELHLVIDADALWFLAEHSFTFSQNVYLTPHAGEAARLLNTSAKEIEQDRVTAIEQLYQRFSGQWVLKGAGSLVLEPDQLWICTTGNAGMGTAGMGDVLAGMIASLKAQLDTHISLSDIVTLHGQAGDRLAQSGQRGIQAHQMLDAIYQVVNP